MKTLLTLVSPRDHTYNPKSCIRKVWLRIMLLLLVPLLSSCYMPYGYLTKIQIAADGRYDIKFSGRLLSTNFMHKLSNAEIPREGPEYEAEKDKHIAALQRQGFTNIDYIFPASYQAQFNKSGNLLTERLVSFPARHGTVLSLKMLENNRLIVQTRALAEGYVSQLESSDIRFVGDVIIWTDLQVEQHNADTVHPGSPDAYLWQFKSLREPPLQLVGTLG